MGALHLTHHLRGPESKSRGKLLDDYTGGQLTLQQTEGQGKGMEHWTV